MNRKQFDEIYRLDKELSYELAGKIMSFDPKANLYCDKCNITFYDILPGHMIESINNIVMACIAQKYGLDISLEYDLERRKIFSDQVVYDEEVE